MIEQIKTYKGNSLAFDVIDGFTETDEKLAQKLFQEKLDQGFSKVNVLMNLDEMKINQTQSKAFWEDTLWALRNYKQIGNIAVVGHSKMLKALVPIDALFFDRLNKGSHERYFDVSQKEEALEFIKPTEGA